MFVLIWNISINYSAWAHYVYVWKMLTSQMQKATQYKIIEQTIIVIKNHTYKLMDRDLNFYHTIQPNL